MNVAKTNVDINKCISIFFTMVGECEDKGAVVQNSARCQSRSAGVPKLFYSGPSSSIGEHGHKHCSHPHVGEENILQV